MSDADGTTLFNAVEAIAPIIEDALTGIVAKKPAFVGQYFNSFLRSILYRTNVIALPLGGVPALILQDLTFLNGNTTAFANALIANAPVSFLFMITSVLWI